MPFGIPRLDVEQHEIDRLQLGVGEAVPVEAVAVESGVNAHRLRRGEQLDREAMLHQRFTAAQREPAGHDLQPVPVFAQFLGGLDHRHRYAVAHRPRIGIVAVAAPPHASGRPRDDADSGTVDGRAGRKGMQESHVAGGERRAHVRLWNVPFRDLPAARMDSSPRAACRESSDFQA